MKKRWDEIKAEEKEGKGREPEAAARERSAIAAGAGGGGADQLPRGARRIRLGERRAGARRSSKKNCTSWLRRGKQASQEEIEGEIGDILFVLVNLARFVKVDPEQALRKSNCQVPPALRACRDSRCSGAGKKFAESEHRGDGRALAGGEARRNDRGPRADRRIDELAEAVRLQKEIWGFAEIELLPVRLFVVATKVGGQVFGAFDGERMIGVPACDSRESSRAAARICTAT